MPFVRYRPVRCSTPGTAAANAGGYASALSVMTRRGVVPLETMARSKEPAGGHHVARRRHVGIDDLAEFVDGAVDVMPAAANSSVGLVHAPVRTLGIAILAGHLAKQR